MQCVDKCDIYSKQIKNTNICSNCEKEGLLIEDNFCVENCSKNYFLTDINY